jgi:hypothetical protein
MPRAKKNSISNSLHEAQRKLRAAMWALLLAAMLCLPYFIYWLS